MADDFTTDEKNWFAQGDEMNKQTDTEEINQDVKSETQEAQAEISEKKPIKKPGFLRSVFTPGKYLEKLYAYWDSLEMAPAEKEKNKEQEVAETIENTEKAATEAVTVFDSSLQANEKKLATFAGTKQTEFASAAQKMAKQAEIAKKDLMAVIDKALDRMTSSEAENLVKDIISDEKVSPEMKFNAPKENISEEEKERIQKMESQALGKLEENLGPTGEAEPLKNTPSEAEKMVKEIMDEEEKSKGLEFLEETPADSGEDVEIKLEAAKQKAKQIAEKQKEEEKVTPEKISQELEQAIGGLQIYKAQEVLNKAKENNISLADPAIEKTFGQGVSLGLKNENIPTLVELVELSRNNNINIPATPETKNLYKEKINQLYADGKSDQVKELLDMAKDIYPNYDKELKSKLREISKLVHPDFVVESQKQEAEEYFKNMQNLYSFKNLLGLEQTLAYFKQNPLKLKTEEKEDYRQAA